MTRLKKAQLNRLLNSLGIEIFGSRNFCGNKNTAIFGGVFYFLLNCCNGDRCGTFNVVDGFDRVGVVPSDVPIPGLCTMDWVPKPVPIFVSVGVPDGVPEDVFPSCWFRLFWNTWESILKFPVFVSTGVRCMLPPVVSDAF